MTSRFGIVWNKHIWHCAWGEGVNKVQFCVTSFMNYPLPDGPLGPTGPTCACMKENGSGAGPFSPPAEDWIWFNNGWMSGWGPGGPGVPGIPGVPCRPGVPLCPGLPASPGLPEADVEPLAPTSSRGISSGGWLKFSWQKISYNLIEEISFTS